MYSIESKELTIATGLVTVGVDGTTAASQPVARLARPRRAHPQPGSNSKSRGSHRGDYRDYPSVAPVTGT